MNAILLLSLGIVLSWPDTQVPLFLALGPDIMHPHLRISPIYKRR